MYIHIYAYICIYMYITESLCCTLTLQINYTSIFKNLHPNHSFLADYYMTKVSP